ncbi:glycosyltransferase [Leptodesmis sp.]|uniref:glycosyltransferase n=1 Tax=Leptodesmis sp. TaxID=3100501 RepID=UPI0040534F3C
MGELGLGLALLSLAIWVGLLTLWGNFWRCDQRLEEGDRGSEIGDQGEIPTPNSQLPSICAVIPARNEADVIAKAIRSLLTQTYPGPFQIVLVDDHSTDGTGEVARKMAEELGQASRLTIVQAAALPAGWTGKLWAMEQGVRYTQTLTSVPDYLLFTDADIEHDRHNLNQLVAKAIQDDLDLVSLMVLLRCESFWEKLLIPAFVFFFQKLYPFPLVNNPNSRIAGAAGGCILIRRETLQAIGGLQTLRQALIDDCSLAKVVKGRRQKAGGKRHEKDRGESREGEGEIQNPKSKIQNSALNSQFSPSTGKIWLGLTQTTRSLRPYESLKTIWNMVARTAYTQLNYSPWLLMGTLVGMVLVYLVLPVSTIAGLLTGHWAIAAVGFLGWGLMTLAYLPTIRLYRLSPLWAVCLPAIALLYNLMTLDSALRHWRGQGGVWKGRVYPARD